MGSCVTGWAHSRKALLAVLLLAGCLEPMPELVAKGAADGGVTLAGCSPFTCTGCCDGAVCRGGNADDGCGYDGRACTACLSTHRCEAPGACYPVPMPRTMPTSSPSPMDGGATDLPPCFPGQEPWDTCR